MQDIATKVEGSQLTAEEFNQIPSELENVITSTGQTLADSDLRQLVKSIAIYAAKGDFYSTSGSANALVLSPINSMQTPISYSLGMRVRFIPGSNNTNTVTISIQNLNAVSLLKNDGTNLGANELVADNIYTATFDGTNFKLSEVPMEWVRQVIDTKANVDLDNLTPRASSYLLPIGTILPYGGSTAPSGFLICNGGAISRTTYANLFAVIGTTYGAGDGSTTFNLPNSSNIVTSVNTSVPVKGTGKSLGMTDGSNNFGTISSLEAGAASARAYGPGASAYGANVGGSGYTRSSGNNRAAVGVTTDASKSGIVGTITRSIMTAKLIIKY